MLLTLQITGPAKETKLVLLTGGWDGNSTFSSNEIFSPSFTISCSPPSLPGERSHHTTFLTAGDKPVVATCGGIDAGSDGPDSFLSSCLVLDAGTGRWEENKIGSLLQKRSNHAAVTLDKFVYILGGITASFSRESTTEFLLAGSRSWEQGPPIPVQMFTPCAVAISGERFLVIEGKEVREFDVSIAGPTRSQGWKEWPKLKTSRSWQPGCTKIGDSVIVAGGSAYIAGTYQTTEILDLKTQKIRKGGNLVTARNSFHMITFDNNGDSTTLALGGKDDDRNALKSIEKWNPETETWSEVEEQLDEKRNSFGLVAAPKNIICTLI